MPPNDLNPEQDAAVHYAAGPLLIIAGAGTGKTRTITARIARLIETGVPASRILAVTFTNKAAQEMRHRIEALAPGHGAKVWMHTFHSFGARVLRQHAAAAGLRPDFLIYDEDDQKKLIQAVLRETGRPDEQNKAGLYISLISRAKDDLLDAESYAIHAQASFTPGRLPVAEVYLRYQAKLQEAGALDFGDLLLRTAGLLKQKDDLREYYQEYFRHVLVDEYQDTNRAQYVITKTLAAKHRNLCVVGDPDQSIYSWRGADIRNILEFEHDFPDAKVIALERNYRSTANILNAADHLIKYNKNRKPKNLYTTKTAGEPVRAEELPTETEEARWVARTIQRLVEEEGSALNEIAVFYRTNAQSRSFEDAFRRAQIPYRLVGTLRFYDRKEIKDALAYVRAIANPLDHVSLTRILNVPARGIGKTAQERLEMHAAEKGIPFYEALHDNANVPNLTPAARRGAGELALLIESMRQQLQDNPPTLILQKVLAVSGYWKSVENEAEKDPETAKSKLGNLQELVNAVKEYEERRAKEDELPTLCGFLEEISLISGNDEMADDERGVTLMTVHLAKGLEFPVVFLTGLEEGLFPIGAEHATDEDMEEERRLCYVGMTRAKTLLFTTYAATRRIFGKVYASMASRFLFESKLMAQAPVRAREEETKVFTPAPQAHAPAGYLTGRKIRHAVYGTGRIIHQTGSGDDVKVTVLFDQGGRSVFMLRYAPIEII